MTNDPIEREIELKEYAGEDRVIPAAEYKAEMAAMMAKRGNAIQSLIPKLDELTNGFEGGNLITISGPTKQGKTTLSHTFTKNFESQGVTSVWFSFEVTPKELFEKFAKTEVFYLPRRLKQRSLEWLKERIEEAKLKYGIRVAFVDHLHYLVDMEKSKNMSVEIGSVIRELKTIAVELDIVIFLMAHMNKTKYNVMPTEVDLRDSSFVAQESDKVFILWRERKKSQGGIGYEFSGKTLLNVAIDRQTGSMGRIVPLVFKENELLPSDDRSYDDVVAEATGDDSYPRL